MLCCSSAQMLDVALTASDRISPLISPTLDKKAFNQLRVCCMWGTVCSLQRDLIKADFSLSSVYRPQAWCRISKCSSCECHKETLACRLGVVNQGLTDCHCAQHVRNDVECSRWSCSRGGRTLWHFQLDWSVSTLSSDLKRMKSAWKLLDRKR